MEFKLYKRNLRVSRAGYVSRNWQIWSKPDAYISEARDIEFRGLRKTTPWSQTKYHNLIGRQK